MTSPPDLQRQPLRAGLATSWALALKDLKVAWSYRLSFIFGHFGVVGSLVMFYFVSRVVGQSDMFGSPDEYFRFIVVGMALAGLVDHSVGAAMGAARRDQVEGTLEAVATLPVGTASLGLGWVTYPLLDALLGAVITVLLAIPLGMVGADPNWLAVFLVLLLSAAIFASFGFVGAAIVLAFQQGAGSLVLVLAALSLISGVLFPVEVMPGWLQTVSELSPLKHCLDAMRAALLEDTPVSDLGTNFLTLLAFLAVLFPAGVAALELGMRRARRTGSLSRF